MNSFDKIIEKYFHKKFAETEIREGDDDWFGFYSINPTDEYNELVLGIHNPDSNDDTWFSNGIYFSEGLQLFNLDPREFNSKLEDYCEKYYPELKIKRIW